MTNEVLNKLEQAFSWGATDAQACRYAGISHQTLYNYCKINEGFLERKEQLKGMVKMRSQMVIDEELSHDDEDFNEKRVELAKWVLKYGAPQEFGGAGNVQTLHLSNITLLPGQTTQQGEQVIRADDLTDAELQRLARGEEMKSVLGNRVIANGEMYPPKAAGKRK